MTIILLETMGLNETPTGKLVEQVCGRLKTKFLDFFKVSTGSVGDDVRLCHR